jgi:hypothetical protein
MAMTQHHPQHYVTFRKDAEQLAVFHDGHSPYGMLGHDFYGFQNGCLGLDDGRGNTGNSEETHGGLRAKRDLEAMLSKIRLTLES